MVNQTQEGEVIMFKDIKKKRFLSLILTVVMVFGLFPAGVFAADSPQVTVSVENTTYVDGAPWTGRILDTEADITEGEMVADVLTRVFAENGIVAVGLESNYISSIDGLAEFDGGGESGWMYTINDWFSNMGVGQQAVAAGDVIAVQYTTNGYGGDLGGSWDNNDKTVKDISFSEGELSPAFDKDTKDYTLTVESDTTGVVVTPTASNKNFQVRTSVAGTEYKRGQTVPISDGTVITVKCGDPSWPTMNPAADVPAETYTIIVEKVPPEESVPYLSDLTGGNITFANGFEPDVYEYTVVAPSNTSSMYIYAYLSDNAPEGSAVTASYTDTSGTAKEVVFTNYDYFAPPYHYGSLSGLIANGALTGNTFALKVGTQDDFQTYIFDVVRQPRITRAVFYDMDETTLKSVSLNATTSANVEFLPEGKVKMKVTGNPTSAPIRVNDETQMASGNTIEITPAWGEDKTAIITLDILADAPAVSNSYTLTCYQEPDSIRIVTPPTKTAYAPGEVFDSTGMVVEAVYADNTIATINTYTIQSVPLLPSVTGITISYGSNTALQPITVEEYSFPGTGAETDPYKLSTTEHLKALSTAVSGGITFAGSYFVMENDITLPEEWTPVGTSIANSFKGIFDGQNYTVNAPADGLPLFGYVVGPTVKNLNIYGPKIAGYGLINNYVVGSGNTIIDNVTLKSGSSTLQSGFIGGYASGSNSITIKDSTVEAGVIVGYDKGQSKIGSFGGDFNGVIDNCVSYATVYGVNKVGGILGAKGQSMGMCKVTNSEFHGAIVATGNYVGGIIGSGYEAGSAPNSPCVTVQNCVSDGSITGGNNVGGILGGEPGINQCWANGIGYIQNNEFSGTISSSGSYVGSIIGRLDSLNLYNVIEDNTYTSDCGATRGIGYVAVVDTSCETVDTSDESVVYINTANSLPNIPGVIRANHNRTDDPLGTDADKLARMLTVEPENTAPALKTGVDATATASINLGEAYTRDLSEIFEDADGDQLTYTVSVDGADAVSAEANYSYTSSETGTYTLVFKANDGKADSEIYTVTLTVGDETSGDIELAKEVDDLIAEIGDPVTLADKAKIEEARAAYNALTEAQKGLVTRLEELQAAEAKLGDLQAAKAVEDKIAAIGTVTLKSKTKIEEARAAYDALPTAQAELVTNYQTLTDAETAYAALVAEKKDADEAKKVDDLIAKISDPVKLADKAKIEEARAAYNALSDPQKNLVTKLEELQNAEAALEDLQAAKTVEDKIAAIGTVTLESKSAIEEARAAYDALSPAVADLVTNYQTLTDAETAYDALVAEKEDVDAAKKVDDLIAKISDPVTLADKAKIEEARAAYDALTDPQKGLATKLDQLKDAEAKLVDLLKPVKAAEKQIKELLAAIGDTEDEMLALFQASKAFDELSDEEKAQLDKQLREKLSALQKQAAKLNHTSNGVQISGLPWYIILTAEPIKEGDSYAAMNKEAEKGLGTGGTILGMYDLRLQTFANDELVEYLLDGETAMITITIPDLAKYKNIKIIHQLLNGEYEYIEPSQIEGNNVTFIVKSLSKYAVVGQLIEEGSQPTPQPGDEQSKPSTEDKGKKAPATGDLNSALPALLLLIVLCAGGYLYCRRGREEKSL